MSMNQTLAGGGSSPQLAIRGFVGVLCILLFHTFTNRYINPLFSAIDAAPAGRLIASVGAMVFFLALLAVAFNKPSAVDVPRITAVTASVYILGIAAMVGGFALSSQPMFVVGGFLAGLGSAWARALALVVLIGLSEAACLAATSSAMIVFYIIKAIVYSLPNAVGVITCSLLAFVALGVAYRPARTIIPTVLPGTPPSALALTEPRKFIPFSHLFFLTLAVFNIACGFSVTFGAVDGIPNSGLAALVPVIAIAAWLLATRKPHTDVVYVIACLFLVAGLLLTLVGEFSTTDIPNTLLASGINIFKIVLIVSLASIARRNPANALPVFAWGELATSVGIWLGDLIGTCVDAVWSYSGYTGELLVAALTLGLVGYNLFALRMFGFDETMGAIETYRDVRPSSAYDEALPNSEQAGKESAETANTQATVSIDKGCDIVAERFGLTERELDVFRYLAHGRNVPFIEEELTISRNTIKTHIRHIYQKIDLHSQQELIDLVESHADTAA